MRRKTKIIITTLLFLVPLFINESLSKSVFYKDVFFYADSIVANHIIQFGHVPIFSTKTISNNSLIYWGKTSTRQSQPILPIFVSMTSLITDSPSHIFYSSLPLYLVRGLFYYILARNFSSAKISIPIAFAGMIGPQSSPINTGARALDSIFFLIVIWLSVYSFRTQESKLPGAILLPITLWSLLFLYPRAFMEAAIFSILSAAALYKIKGRVAWGGLITIICGVWVIFYIPFNVYAFYASDILLFITGSGNLLSSASSTVLSTALKRPRYGLIAIIPLFLLGLLGGIKVLFDIKNWFLENDPIQYAKIPMFLWGVSSIIFSLMHIATGQIWLVSRYIPISLPLATIAVSIGLQDISLGLSERVNGRVVLNILLIMIVSSVFLSYTFIAGSAWTNIHTYSSQEIESAEWINNNSNEIIISDLSQGALLAQNSHTARYPLNQSSVHGIFYSQNMSKFNIETEAGIFLLNREMTTDGFFIPSYPRRPISTEHYNTIIYKSNVIYSNGDSRVIDSKNDAS
ncbi:hypothetical protein [Haloarcula nitratireducens]|uniref:Glycosyltransferase RgtA/B/C/D-like domain-containing protein n=1 Tax=Haloarcula nitratireducens TaxID=2487749 RepID=A0AAW4PGU9_9EURY|nr:hypothetical protein [Halomicroarcula nitratireducens]MBX0296665.1 hypothetical protein [Halomicroarcula nitratireducens]